MTRRSALSTAESAIARQKLEQRLDGMRARGVAASEQREAAFCLECVRDLELICGVYACPGCGMQAVDVQGARLVTRKGRS